MRVLITGITGFVGSHLVENLLHEGGFSLHGLSRQGRWSSELAHLSDQVQLYPVDLGDTEALRMALEKVQPEWIFHFAGYANTGASFKEPRRCWHDNLTATQNLYDTALTLAKPPRILFTSTGLIYGDPDQPGVGCDESTVFKPASPYAASKAATDVLSYQVSRNEGLPIIRIRLFNQFGARQSPDYALARFAKQIALIEAGKQEPTLNTGDLSSYRDLTDVRDMVRAMRLLIEKGIAGEAYNAGSGRAMQIRELVSLLIRQSSKPISIAENIDPSRKADTAISWGDVRKLRAATGWGPQYSLEESLAELLNYWRRTV